MFTRELVDAFDASAAFLYCLESQIFTPYKEQGCDFNQDLRQRAEYAEWRAYDVAVALRSGRAPTEVADAFDDTDGGGEFLNAGVAGISLAAAAPPRHWIFPTMFQNQKIDLTVSLKRRRKMKKMRMKKRINNNTNKKSSKKKRKW